MLNCSVMVQFLRGEITVHGHLTKHGHTLSLRSKCTAKQVMSSGKENAFSCSSTIASNKWTCYGLYQNATLHNSSIRCFGEVRRWDRGTARHEHKHPMLWRRRRMRRRGSQSLVLWTFHGALSADFLWAPFLLFCSRLFSSWNQRAFQSVKTSIESYQQLAQAVQTLQPKNFISLRY